MGKDLESYGAARRALAAAKDPAAEAAIKAGRLTADRTEQTGPRKHLPTGSMKISVSSLSVACRLTYA